MLIRVAFSRFVAGVIVQDNICVEADPMLQWTIGKTKDYVLKKFQEKKYDIQIYS